MKGYLGHIKKQKKKETRQDTFTHCHKNLHCFPFQLFVFSVICVFLCFYYFGSFCDMKTNDSKTNLAFDLDYSGFDLLQKGH